MRTTLVGLLFAASLSLTFPALADDVKVGVAGPMSGGLAAFGEQIKWGAQLAADDLNQGGGLLGRKVVLLTEDDACDPKQAHNVASRMVVEKASVVFGH